LQRYGSLKFFKSSSSSCCCCCCCCYSSIHGKGDYGGLSIATV